MSKELEEQIIKEIREKTQADITNIFDNITVPDITSLPEEVFVHTFLPLFHGDIKDIETRTTLTQDWINIAGGPSEEVSVINNKGEEIYKVPPIFNSSAISVTEKGRRSIAEIITASESEDFKPKAELQLRADLDVRQEELLAKSEQSRTETVNNLNNIFSRYNLSKFGEISEEDKNESISDDDITYEDD